jgi:hypothetical protein
LGAAAQPAEVRTAPLLKFLALSALLHCALLFSTQHPLALPSGGAAVLSATLVERGPPIGVPLPAAPPQEQIAAPQPKPVKKTKAKPRRKNMPAPAATIVPEAVTPPVSFAEGATMAASVEAAPAASIEVPADAPEADTAPAINAQSAESSPSPAPSALLGTLPNLVEIDYDLRRGEDGAALGALRLIWRRDGGRYEVVGRPREPHAALPSVDAAAAGASPAPAERGDGEPVARAGNMRPLADKAQDLLSLLLHFNKQASTQRGGDATRATGEAIEQMDFESAGSEVINVGGVEVETLRLRLRADANQRSTEVWLGVASHHLPVKIRISERGAVIEQIATNIRVE